jgi:hypothetical protein
MYYLWLANVVLALHLGFVVFVVLGGLLVLRWPRLSWLHVPVALWGVFLEYAGLVCPLTPLESALRQRGGEAGYAGGFIEHYLTASLYPAGLTRGLQILLGTLVVAINGVVYWRVAVCRGGREEVLSRGV